MNLAFFLIDFAVGCVCGVVVMVVATKAPKEGALLQTRNPEYVEPTHEAYE